MKTYKEFVDMHVQYLKDHPSLGHLPACYASDDEGNSYHEIYITTPLAERVELDYGDERMCVIIN